MKANLKSIVLSILVLFLSVSFLNAAELNLGSGEGSPGGTVSVPVTLTGARGIAAASVDIAYNTALLTNPKAEIGPSGKSAGKEVYASAPFEGVFRVGILGLNLNEISDGVVATVSFEIVSGSSSGKTIELKNTPTASDAKGNAVKVSGSNGVITIR